MTTREPAAAAAGIDASQKEAGRCEAPPTSSEPAREPGRPRDTAFIPRRPTPTPAPPSAPLPGRQQARLRARLHQSSLPLDTGTGYTPVKHARQKECRVPATPPTPPPPPPTHTHLPHVRYRAEADRQAQARGVAGRGRPSPHRVRHRGRVRHRAGSTSDEVRQGGRGPTRGAGGGLDEALGGEVAERRDAEPLGHRVHVARVLRPRPPPHPTHTHKHTHTPTAATSPHSDPPPHALRV